MPPTSFLLGPLKKEVIQKVVLRYRFQNMIVFPFVKLGLHAKDETHSSKIQQVMAIFVYQGEAKSQFQKILKYQNLAQI